MKQSFLPINKLSSEPYSRILGFPKASKRQLQPRINELNKLKVKRIPFEGNTLIGTLNVLGKGYVGIVVLGKMQDKKAAVKIRRTDSPRDGMNGEAGFLKIANDVKVVPKLIGHSNNFMVM